jgi:hypothetical protein
VALLTNRVHPTRANDAHVKIRPRVHDAVMDILAKSEDQREGVKA